MWIAGELYLLRDIFYHIPMLLRGHPIFKKIFIHSLLAMPGLCCCAGFSAVAASGDYSLAGVCRLLVVVDSLVEYGP